MRTLLMVFVVSLLSASEAAGQTTPACRVLCAPEFKVEPTVTFTNLFGSPRTVDEQGRTTREPRGTEFEVILSFGLPTRASWLEFTVEAIFLPFDRKSTPESAPTAGSVPISTAFQLNPTQPTTLRQPIEQGEARIEFEIQLVRVRPTICRPLGGTELVDGKPNEVGLELQLRTRYVPGLVLAEVDYFLRDERQAMQVFMQDLASGAFTYAPPTIGQLARAMDVDRRFVDRGLGLVDGSIVALAESLGIRRLATRDVRHFAAVRLRDGRAFDLVVQATAPDKS